ncbi:MAG: arginyltransferase, partial [Spirochaetia bacterium]|nr:arginyltransferase [Spirochaetia bacterium]
QGKVGFDVQLSLDTIEEQMYLGHLHNNCPYLPDRFSSLLFLDGGGTGLLYRLLLDQGYRRHGKYLYRPDCTACAECKVLRVPIESFQRSQSQGRVWKKNQGLFEAMIQEPRVDDERLDVYRAYLASQHKNENPTSPSEYADFFVNTCLDNHSIELSLRYQGRLAGIGILDRLGDALSSVYFYFHPDFARMSPGTFSVLYEIELARSWGMRYYYPGYYIQDCKTMKYKSNFRPCEVLSDGVWQNLS